MKRSYLLWIVLLSLAAAPLAMVSNVRSAKPLGITAGTRPAPFDRTQSAALFVGIRDFDDSSIADVDYAVDDAVDLAYAFAIEENILLVPPERVAIAISGKPRKKESQRHLQELESAGAAIHVKPRALLELLQQQTALAGEGGLFIASFATHGYSFDGVPYVLTSTSTYRDRDSALSTAKVLDVIGTSAARRSLVFVDACRERIMAARAGQQEPQAAAPLLEAMNRIEGQVVFYAAAAGKYAFDNPRRRNGVFTAAVVDGLRCGAASDANGFITAETLGRFVETKVRAWLQQHRHPELRSAIQVVMDGGTEAMPLAHCGVRIPGPRLPIRLGVAAFDGTRLDVSDATGRHAWSQDVKSRIVSAKIADVNGDERDDVIVATAGGHIIAFDAKGQQRWTADTMAPSNYARAGGPTAIEHFLVGSVFSKATREIVVGTANASESRVTIFDGNGRLLSAYCHPGRVTSIVVDRQTSRHAPKVILSAVNDDLERHCVFMLDPRRSGGEAPPYRGRLAEGRQVWYGIIDGVIERLTVIDHDNDGDRDIAVTTSSGGTSYLNFDGEVIAGSGAFTKLAARTRESAAATPR